MGIYIHIPFCRSKCYYCGFYSVASISKKDAYIQALIKEMDMRKDYLDIAEIKTLYFGGGTPSYLHIDELAIIITELKQRWHFAKDMECSIELNPEDASFDKLTSLKKLGFNRLTFGIQSFDNELLRSVNRTHSSKQAVNAVRLAKEVGFTNIGIDLIIGLPSSNHNIIKRDLEIARSLNVEHISLYMFSVDANTVFEKRLQQGKIALISDDELGEQYLYVSSYLKDNGYDHYEISNFALDSKYSKHNLSYWQQQPYLGLGAAAHSFDGNSRQWNVANINTYINALSQDKLSFEKEMLSEVDKYNEYIMTSFRTRWGLDVDYIKCRYPKFWGLTDDLLQRYIQDGIMILDKKNLRLTERGWLISDAIFTELFV